MFRLSLFLLMLLVGATQDRDGDGYFGAGDCNEYADWVHDGARELCDGLDNDCDAVVDEQKVCRSGLYFWCYDDDGDGCGSNVSGRDACLWSAGKLFRSGRVPNGADIGHSDGDATDCTPPPYPR